MIPPILGDDTPSANTIEANRYTESSLPLRCSFKSVVKAYSDTGLYSNGYTEYLLWGYRYSQI